MIDTVAVNLFKALLVDRKDEFELLYCTDRVADFYPEAGSEGTSEMMVHYLKDTPYNWNLLHQLADEADLLDRGWDEGDFPWYVEGDAEECLKGHLIALVKDDYASVCDVCGGGFISCTDFGDDTCWVTPEGETVCGWCLRDSEYSIPFIQNLSDEGVSLSAATLGYMHPETFLRNHGFLYEGDARFANYPESRKNLIAAVCPDSDPECKLCQVVETIGSYHRVDSIFGKVWH